MNISVKPHVVAGTDRGGEDLFLVFFHECDGSEIPTTEPRLEFELYDSGATITDGDREIDVIQPHVTLRPGAQEADVIQTRLGAGELSIRYSTECGFTWCGKVEDALAIIAHMVRDSAYWHFCHSPGEPERLRFEHTYFVDGNAE